MIWRSNLTHQDYMKHDIQSMTTKFSIRPTGKAKMKENVKQSSIAMPITNHHQQHHHYHHNKHDSVKIDKENEKEKKMMDQDDDDDDDIYNDFEDEDEEDDNADNDNEFNNNNNNNDPTMKKELTTSTTACTEVISQGIFLNFSSDLSPQTVPRKRKKSTSTKSQKAAYKVNGVNILNRKNLDSKTAIERLQRRRENHNHVERRRRDTINNIIYELSQVVPHAIWSGQKPHKGNILKATLDYILTLQEENRLYKEQLNQHHQSSEIPTLIQSTLSSLPSTIQQSNTNNNNNTCSSLSSSLSASPSSWTISHLSPVTAIPSINNPSLSPIPVHNNNLITTSDDHTTTINNNDNNDNHHYKNKKIRFIPLEMDDLEKTYNNTCHY